MQERRKNTTHVIVILLLLSMVAAPMAMAAKIYVVYGHTGEIRVIDTSVDKAFDDFSGPTDTHTSNGVTFGLYYEDVRQNLDVGFDGANGAAARARIRDVLDEVAATLNESGAIDIIFDPSQTDGSGYLASAGTWFSGAPDSFLDPTSLVRLRDDSKPDPNAAEIYSTVDFGWNYNFTTNPTTGSQVDFFSVMLHEFGHGLGFVVSTNEDGSTSFGGGTRSSLSEFAVKGQGGTALFLPAWNGSAGDLTSNDVFYGGDNGVALYGQGVQPGLYAPSPWAQGSSMSHWDTGNIVGGAVMEHVIVAGVDTRAFAPVDVGALLDIGWEQAAVPAAEGEGEGQAEGEGEGQVEGEGEGQVEGEEPCEWEGVLLGQGDSFDASLPGLDQDLADLFAGFGWTVYEDWDIEFLEEVIDLIRPLPGDGLPDAHQLALVEFLLCNPGYMPGLTADFEANKALFAADVDTLSGVDSSLLALALVADWWAALMGTSADMQNALDELTLELTEGATGLPSLGSYVVFGTAKTAGEPLSADGDLDNDGLSNIEEYGATESVSPGDIDLFVTAATSASPFWPGNPVLPVGGVVAIALLAGALGLGGAVIRRKK